MDRIICYSVMRWWSSTTTTLGIESCKPAGYRVLKKIRFGYKYDRITGPEPVISDIIKFWKILFFTIINIEKKRGNMNLIVIKSFITNRNTL